MKRLASAVLFVLVTVVSQVQAGESRVVIRVVSGDTMIVDGGQAVKLLGVSAPAGDEYLAEEAKQYVAEQLLGREVMVETDNRNSLIGHKDAMGRKLAYVYRSSDDFFINAVLIQQGRGFLTTQYINKFLAKFQTFQLEARKAKLGVWAKTDITPEEQAKSEGRRYEEPRFENKQEYKYPDIRVEILWAKKADPRFRTARTSEEAKFLELIYQDDTVGKGAVSLFVKLRRNLAEALTKYYTERDITLVVKTSGEDSETLVFDGVGMDKETADKFLEIRFNLELFSGLEFKTVIFTDDKKTVHTYKVEK